MRGHTIPAHTIKWNVVTRAISCPLATPSDSLGSVVLMALRREIRRHHGHFSHYHPDCLVVSETLVRERAA